MQATDKLGNIWYYVNRPDVVRDPEQPTMWATTGLFEPGSKAVRAWPLTAYGIVKPRYIAIDSIDGVKTAICTYTTDEENKHIAKARRLMLALDNPFLISPFDMRRILGPYDKKDGGDFDLGIKTAETTAYNRIVKRIEHSTVVSAILKIRYRALKLTPSINLELFSRYRAVIGAGVVKMLEPIPEDEHGLIRYFRSVETIESYNDYVKNSGNSFEPGSDDWNWGFVVYWLNTPVKPTPTNKRSGSPLAGKAKIVHA
jgi:hypothetical protein